MRILAALVAALQLSAQFLPRLGGIPVGAGGGGGMLTVNSQMPSGAGVTSSTSPWTWSFTNTAGTVLYLFLAIDGTTQPTVTVAYGGGAMTQLGSQFAGSGLAGTIFLFRRTSPATGANNFVISWNTGTQVAIAGAISFTGNNSVPDNGAATSTSYGGTTSTTFGLTVSSTTSGNIVIQGACYGDAGHSTQTGTLSDFLEVNNASYCNNQEVQYQTVAASSTTASFTNTTATSWATIGIQVIKQ